MVFLKSGSISSAIVTLSVGCIGAGILAFPLAFADAGVVLSMFLLVVMGIFTVASIYFLALGIEFGNFYSYEELSEKLLGERYLKAARCMLILLNFGVKVGFIVVVGEMLAPVQPYAHHWVCEMFGIDLNNSGISAITLNFTSLDKYHHHHHHTAVVGGAHSPNVLGHVLYWVTSERKTMLVTVWLCVLFPVSFFRRLDNLRHTTVLAISSTCYIVLGVTYRYFFPFQSEVRTVTVDGHNFTLNSKGSALFDEYAKTHNITSSVVRSPGALHYYYEIDERVLEKISHRLKGSNFNFFLMFMDGDSGSSSDSTAKYSNIYFNFHVMMFLALPIMIYSLDCQCFIFQIYTDIRPKHKQNAKTITVVALAAISLACMLYACIGTFGAASFHEKTRGNILQNFNPLEDHVMLVGYIGYIIPVVMAYAINMFPCRDAVFNLVYGMSAADLNVIDDMAQAEAVAAAAQVSAKYDQIQEREVASIVSSDTRCGKGFIKFHPWHFYLISVTISVSCMLVAIVTPGIVAVVSLLGALFSSTLCFTYPALFRMKMAEKGIVPYGFYTIRDFFDLTSRHLPGRIESIHMFRSTDNIDAMRAKATCIDEYLTDLQSGVVDSLTENTPLIKISSSALPNVMQYETLSSSSMIIDATNPNNTANVITTHTIVAKVERLIAYMMLYIGVFGATIGCIVACVKIASGEQPSNHMLDK